MSKQDSLRKILFTLAPTHPTKPATGLYEVIRSRQLDRAREFVAAGHDTRTRFTGGSVVDLSIKYGDLEFVKFIIENGPPVSGDKKSEPLIKAIQRASDADAGERDTALAILDYLLTQAFTENEIGNAYLTCARRRDLAAARLVLAAGVNPQTPIYYDYQKSNPLIDVLATKHPEFAALLRGEDVKQVTTADELSLVSDLASSLLSSFGLSTPTENSHEEEKDSQLLKGEEHRQQCELLAQQIEAGEWDEIIQSQGRNNPIEFAAQSGLGQIVAAALTRNPDHTYLRISAEKAAIFGHLDIVKAIVEHGVNLMVKEGTCSTTLSNACHYGHVDLVNYLLQRGENPRLSNDNGVPLFDIAGGYRMQEVKRLLVEFARQYPAEWKSGYAVKGKPSDWSQRQNQAIAKCIEDWHSFCQLWIRAGLDEVVEYFKETCSAQGVLDLKKNALPSGECIVCYQLVNEPFVCVLPVVTSAERDRLLHLINEIMRFAQKISAALATQVYCLNADDSAGEFVSSWHAGQQDLDCSEHVKLLSEQKLVLLPSYLESNGFEHRITFNNIRKSEIARAVAVCCSGKPGS